MANCELYERHSTGLITGYNKQLKGLQVHDSFSMRTDVNQYFGISGGVAKPVSKLDRVK